LFSLRRHHPTSPPGRPLDSAQTFQATPLDVKPQGVQYACVFFLPLLLQDSGGYGGHRHGIGIDTYSEKLQCHYIAHANAKI
jgi:hypothetical protein